VENHLLFPLSAKSATKIFFEEFEDNETEPLTDSEIFQVF